jgi:hypothetical protein
VCFGLHAQLLVVNRGFDPAHTSAKSLRLPKPGFLGDHFRIGASGEVWIIDTIRTWARTDESSRLGDVFERIALFGGIEAAPPVPGQPPQPECDCHNLLTIKAGTLPLGENVVNGDVVSSRVSSGLWQIDFGNLHWSVPGGVDLQFGVAGTSRTKRRVWTDQLAPTTDPHLLKTFDEKGKLEGPYPIDDHKLGLNVQVWAHRSAPVTVRSAASAIEVVLRSDGTFDATQTDASTLRFGPRNASAIATRTETVDGHTALVARFRRADVGLQSVGVMSACLTGRLHDGVPFEGCDLIASK